jgi:hypothetical protein
MSDAMASRPGFFWKSEGKESMNRGRSNGLGVDDVDEDGASPVVPDETEDDEDDEEEENEVLENEVDDEADIA